MIVIIGRKFHMLLIADFTDDDGGIGVPRAH